ncbi:hypothetical protein D3C86_1325560 [compost metagenome]
MMRSAVDAVDDQVATVVEFVGQPLADYATDHRDGARALCAVHHEFTLLTLERSSHRSQRVLALTHRLERGRHARSELPTICTRPLGKSDLFKPLQPRSQNVLTLPIRGVAREVDADFPARLPDQRPV